MMMPDVREGVEKISSGASPSGGTAIGAYAVPRLACEGLDLSRGTPLRRRPRAADPAGRRRLKGHFHMRGRNAVTMNVETLNPRQRRRDDPDYVEVYARVTRSGRPVGLEAGPATGRNGAGARRYEVDRNVKLLVAFSPVTSIRQHPDVGTSTVEE